MTGLCDSFQRSVDYLRISVTDRCNLRCIYCMPTEGIRLIQHQDVLTYEEIHTVVRAAAEMGINKLRLTGGEPLVRLGLPRLVEMLAAVPGIDDITMTTNGTLLARYAAELKESGLKRVNISLDSLRPERFRQITRSASSLDEVLRGIDAAHSAGLNPVKINVVVMAGINDDEVADLAARTVTDGWNVCFIEFMPIYDILRPDLKFVSASAIKERLRPLGDLIPYGPPLGNGPARYFKLPQSTGSIGFISPVSEHFCFQCNRLRLTADGMLRPCLLSNDEIDLKSALREEVSPESLRERIKTAVASKPHRHHLGSGEAPSGHRPMTQVGG